MGDAGVTETASLMVASVALIISLVALTVTTAQLTQQYLATAVGYANCGQRVMGPWAQHTRLRFQPRQLRFEVLFDVPVFTLGLLNQPISAELSTPAAPIQYLDKIPADLPFPDESIIAGVHQASGLYGRSATWLFVMFLLHQMEVDSRRWHTHRRGQNEPSSWQSGLPIGLQTKLSIGVQRRTYSLDMMPDGAKRPFASTAFTNLIGMVAMLGAHWKQFDRREDRYLAEGNGCLITGNHVPFLGIVFSFYKSGRNEFSSRRVIPSPDMKLYCFGYARTIFWKGKDYGRVSLNFNPGVGYNVAVLKLTSREKTAQWISTLRCHRRTCGYFLDKWEGNTSHIFPIAFELLGMIGINMHIRDADFCMLPNPTAYPWDSSCSSSALLKGFKYHLRLSPSFEKLIQPLKKLISFSDEIIAACSEPTTQNPEDEAFFADCVPPTSKIQGLLHDTISECDVYLTVTLPQRLVLVVLRTHLDVVLDLLNDNNFGAGDAKPLLDSWNEDVRADLLRSHEESLMRAYVKRVLPRVIIRATAPASRREAEAALFPTVGELESYKTQVVEAWTVLVFRMICWLWLHDFHEDDVQIASKSDLFGSRLRVYIN